MVTNSLSKILKIYIVIVNYNNWWDTIECVESILKNNYSNYNLIIVDNNSINNSMDYLKSWVEGRLNVLVGHKSLLKGLSFPPINKPIPYLVYTREEAEKGGNLEIEKISCNNAIIFIKCNDNLGFAGGNNVAIKYILTKDNSGAVLLLNNDTAIEKDILYKMASFYNKFGLGLYSGRIFYYDNPEIIWYDGGHFNKWLGRGTHINMGKKGKSFKNIIRTVNFVSFCVALIPIKILKDIGPLDESYFMYVEDLDYSYKVLNKGYNLYHIYGLKVYHKAGASIGRELSPFSSYWLMKNRVRFILNKLSGIHRVSSMIFILLSRLIIYPSWIIRGKIKIMISQLKAIRDGFAANRH